MTLAKDGRMAQTARIGLFGRLGIVPEAAKSAFRDRRPGYVADILAVADDPGVGRLRCNQEPMTLTI